MNSIGRLFADYFGPAILRITELIVPKRIPALVAERLIGEIHDLMLAMTAEFNEQIGHAEALSVTVTAIGEDDARTADDAGNAQKNQSGYRRVLIYTSAWALSIRGKNALVEVFLIPTNELNLFSKSELPSRRKVELKCMLANGSERFAWMLEGQPISVSERNILLRSLFNDMVVRSKSTSDVLPEALRLPLAPGGESLSRSVRALLSEKQSLVQKVVTQQEQLQSRIARELHDTVIADIMMLRRSLCGDKALGRDEMVGVLDEITEHLYQMCEDLTPRDLKDWGLKTVVAGLLNKTAARSKATCVLNMCDNLPQLPEEVELHIYRVVQESLNNIEKHSLANHIEVSFTVEKGLLCVTVQDNGRGFESQAAPGLKPVSGGRGTNIMRERAELISCYFPATLFVESQASGGTAVKLQLQYSVNS